MTAKGDGQRGRYDLRYKDADKDTYVQLQLCVVRQI